MTDSKEGKQAELCVLVWSRPQLPAEGQSRQEGWKVGTTQWRALNLGLARKAMGITLPLSRRKPALPRR